MTPAATKTVGEIAVEMPSATREFEKLGIDYCCGGSRTLGQACVEANISVDQALARLKKVWHPLTATPDRIGKRSCWRT